MSTALRHQSFQRVQQLPGLPHALLHGLCQKNKVALRFVSKNTIASTGNPMDKGDDFSFQRLTDLPGVSFRQSSTELRGSLHKVLAPPVCVGTGCDPETLDRGGLFQEVNQPSA